MADPNTAPSCPAAVFFPPGLELQRRSVPTPSSLLHGPQAMQACEFSTFAAGLVVRVINAPPFESGVDASRFSYECEDLATLFRNGRARCDNTSSAAAGVTEAQADAAAGELLPAFIEAFVSTPFVPSGIPS